MPILSVLFIYIFLVVYAIPISAEDRPLPLTCSYEERIWNVNQKRSVIVKTIYHPYSELTREEIDPVTGCTVCSEDQSLINIPPLPAFSVCYKIAPKVLSLFEELRRHGAPIFTVMGYHVVKSRGIVDNVGNRTGFSNHSYGTAIDINPDQNGLYDNCIQFGPDCRLIRGGVWRPGAIGSLENNGDIVTTLKTAGFRWGGEIAGKQKDFMHFSSTGY